MSGDELFSADPEKILKRAMSDVRFARSGYEAGHDEQALLLVIRGLEKMLLYHLMIRDIPYSRETSSLAELFESLSETVFYETKRRDLCDELDVFQFARRDEVMDIIQNDNSYMKLSDLDEEDVNEKRAHHAETLEDEVLEDWENDEWGPEGWSKKSDDGADEAETGNSGDESIDTPTESTVEEQEAGAPSGDDNHGEAPSVDDLPDTDTLYERSIDLFKALYEHVDPEV